MGRIQGRSPLYPPPSVARLVSQRTLRSCPASASWVQSWTEQHRGHRMKWKEHLKATRGPTNTVPPWLLTASVSSLCHTQLPQGSVCPRDVRISYSVPPVDPPAHRFGSCGSLSFRQLLMLCSTVPVCSLLCPLLFRVQCPLSTKKPSGPYKHHSTW